MAYVDGELYVKVWVVIMGVYALQMLLVPAKMTTAPAMEARLRRNLNLNQFRHQHPRRRR